MTEPVWQDKTWVRETVRVMRRSREVGLEQALAEEGRAPDGVDGTEWGRFLASLAGGRPYRDPHADACTDCAEGHTVDFDARGVARHGFCACQGGMAARERARLGSVATETARRATAEIRARHERSQQSFEPIGAVPDESPALERFRERQRRLMEGDDA